MSIYSFCEEQEEGMGVDRGRADPNLACLSLNCSCKLAKW